MGYLPSLAEACSWLILWECSFLLNKCYFEVGAGHESSTIALQWESQSPHTWQLLYGRAPWRQESTHIRGFCLFLFVNTKTVSAKFWEASWFQEFLSLEIYSQWWKNFRDSNCLQPSPPPSLHLYQNIFVACVCPYGEARPSSLPFQCWPSSPTSQSWALPHTCLTLHSLNNTQYCSHFLSNTRNCRIISRMCG